MKTEAAVLYGKDEPFRLEQVELAPPKSGEVLVEVAASGICHTDAVARAQIIPVPLPVVLGHEGSGVVMEVGPGVTTLHPGDHVGFSFGCCGQCGSCLSAQPFACDHFNQINFGGVMPDGTKRISKDGQEISTFFGQSSFARHAVVNQASVVKVDADMDLSLVGPLGCGIQTGAGAVLNRLRPVFGTTIAVFGCGTVGMSALMAAVICGCKEIIAVDVNPANLALAKKLGATQAINAKETTNLVAELKELSHGGLHYAVDATGSAASIKNALAALRFSGTVVVVGVTGELTLNVQEELMGEGKTLTGCVEGDANSRVFIPELLNYYKAGRFPFDHLITFFDFKDINAIFDQGHAGVIKAVLKMS